MDKSKISISIDDTEYGAEPATFNSWLYGIMKGGFGLPAVAELMQYSEQLYSVYQIITYEKNGSRYYSSKYDRKLVEANIRKAFCDKLDFKAA